MIETEFDALEKNIQYWYMIYQTIHKKISDWYFYQPNYPTKPPKRSYLGSQSIHNGMTIEERFGDEYKEYRNAITQLQRVKKKYGTIDITDIKDLHR
tara:strand:+ start:238 stop:528 length:291 start_codon:yes stop_codon:yes gene_type:complete